MLLRNDPLHRFAVNSKLKAEFVLRMAKSVSRSDVDAAQHVANKFSFSFFVRSCRVAKFTKQRECNKWNGSFGKICYAWCCFLFVFQNVPGERKFSLVNLRELFFELCARICEVTNMLNNLFFQLLIFQKCYESYDKSSTFIKIAFMKKNLNKSTVA